MISNITKMEIKIGERVYQFLCDCNSPLGEVHDALAFMKSHVIAKMKEAEQPPCSESPEGED